MRDCMRYVFSQPSGSLGFTELSDSAYGPPAGQHAVRFNNEGDTVWTSKIEGLKWRKDADGNIRGLRYGGESDNFVFISQEGSISSFPIKKRGVSVYYDVHTPALDGSYVLVGSRWVSQYSTIISRVTSLGDTIWTKEHAPFPQDFYPFFSEIIPTKDSGYVAVGGILYATSPVGDILVIKINNEGDLVWSDTLRTNSWNYEAQIIELSSGDLLIATTQYANSNALYRLSSDGDSLSAISFSYFGDFSRMVQSSNGDFGLVYVKGLKVLDNNLSEKYTLTWSEITGTNLRGFWIDATSQGWIIGGDIPHGLDSSDAFILSVNENGLIDP